MIDKGLKLPGEILQEDLDNHGWFQRDLSKLTGIDPSTLNRIMQGTQGLTPARAEALSKVTGRDMMDYLYADANLKALRYLERRKRAKSGSSKERKT